MTADINPSELREKIYYLIYDVVSGFVPATRKVSAVRACEKQTDKVVALIEATVKEAVGNLQKSGDTHSARPTASTPNPGSEAAQDLGCICPVLDNGYGKLELGGHLGFWIAGGCRLHDKSEVSTAASPDPDTITDLQENAPETYPLIDFREVNKKIKFKPPKDGK